MDIGYATSNGPNNELADEYMHEYLSQKKIVDEAQGAMRAILKRAKDSGLNTGSIKRACKAKRHDEDDVISDLRDDLRYMSILRIGITPEALFEGWTGEVSAQTREADNVWDAEDRGYQDGRHGKPREDCPYPEGPLAHAYQRSWEAGQASIAKEMGGGEQLAPTRGAGKRRRAATKASEPLALVGPAPAKRGRGRPRKNVEEAAAP
jgi:hypothetical protein